MADEQDGSVEAATEGILSLIQGSPEGRKAVEGSGDSPEEGDIQKESKEGFEDPADDSESEDEDLADLLDDESEGDEADEDADEGASDDEPETFTVHVNGKPIEVSLEEALQGYQRTQDYTRKTQEVAEQRKQLRDQAELVGQQRQQYLQRLAAVQQALQTVIPPEPDVALKAKDPEAYNAQLVDFVEWRQNAQAVQQEQHRVLQEQEAENRERRAEYVASQQERLLELIPEWHDPAVRDREEADLIAYAEASYGAGADELGQLIDARWVDLIRKSMLYDRMVESGASIRSKVKASKGKALKPGMAKSGKVAGKTQAKAAVSRLAKSGSVHDAAEAIRLSMLDG